MNHYIRNLTDNLIGKNSYYESWSKFENDNAFLRFVKIDLQSSDVRDMRPETLGKVMCSFEIGDVRASPRELFYELRFSGDCEDFLREMVATCLAFVIRDRYDPDRHPGIPPAHTKK